MQSKHKPTTVSTGTTDWLGLIRHKAEGVRDGRIVLDVTDCQVTVIEIEEASCLYKATSPVVASHSIDHLHSRAVTK